MAGGIQHSSRIDFRVEAKRAFITLCRPEAQNALNESLLAALAERFAIAAASGDTEAIYIQSSSDVWMTGADLPFFVRALLAGDLDRLLRFTRAAHLLLSDLQKSRVPTIARVEGTAFGAGLELALACQKIIAGPKARFALPETGLGIYPGMGGTQRLPRRIGIGLAKWMIYTGSIVPAGQALELGLVDALAEDVCERHGSPSTSSSSAVERTRAAHFEQLESLFTSHSVSELCDPSFALPAEAPLARAIIQLRGKAPLALAAAEKLIDDGQRLPLDAAIELEFSGLRDIFSTADARAGLLSLGKSRVTFSGS